MISQLFPRSADNTYHGHKPALWLFGLVIVLRVVMSLNSVLNTHTTARYADGIPLHTYTAAGEQAAASLFAMMGLYSFVICLACIMVLIRYRSLVPIMFALLLVQVLGAKLVLHFRPIVRIGTPPAIYVSLVLIALIVIGLAFSIRWKTEPAPR